MNVLHINYQVNTVTINLLLCKYDKILVKFVTTDLLVYTFVYSCTNSIYICVKYLMAYKLVYTVFSYADFEI